MPIKSTSGFDKAPLPWNTRSYSLKLGTMADPPVAEVQADEPSSEMVTSVIPPIDAVMKKWAIIEDAEGRPVGRDIAGNPALYDLEVAALIVSTVNKWEDR